MWRANELAMQLEVESNWRVEEGESHPLFRLQVGLIERILHTTALNKFHVGHQCINTVKRYGGL